MSDRTPGSFLPLTHLVYQILLALGREPLHGYAIIKQVEEWTGGQTIVRSGTLYAAIQRLVDDGLVEPTEQVDAPGVDARRRYYRLTARGRDVATAESERLGRLLRAAAASDLAGAAGGNAER